MGDDGVGVDEGRGKNRGHRHGRCHPDWFRELWNDGTGPVHTMHLNESRRVKKDVRTDLGNVTEQNTTRLVL